MYTPNTLTFVELPISNSYSRNKTAFINLYLANHIINESIQFSHPKDNFYSIKYFWLSLRYATLGF